MANKFPLSYAGVEFPSSVGDSFQLTLNPLEASAERLANGRMFLQNISIFKSISATWGALKGDEAHLILSTLKNNRTGILIYYDISEKTVVSWKAYWGTGAKTNYYLYDENSNRQIYTALTVNFIEM